MGFSAKRFSRLDACFEGLAVSIWQLSKKRDQMTDAATLASIAITLNGEPRRARAGMSVADLVEELGLPIKKVAVERNLEIVPRSTLAGVLLADGDQLEIVHFVGGG
jgi:thiamine biosynthesis protein ThiS